MLDPRLHADHIDTSGAYAQRFSVVQELVESGVLSEIPKEFRSTTPDAPKSNVHEHSFKVNPVPSNAQVVPCENFTREHADHNDETGQYRRDWESRNGPMENNIPETNSPAQETWRGFLTDLISEEKKKLQK